MTADVVGVDIGGSKTQGLRVGADGATLAAATVGSANIESVSHQAAAIELDRLFDELGRDGIGVVCVGSAGVNTAEQRAWLSGLITQRAPGARVLVAHDTRLILATPQLDAGIAVICGTGSVAWGRDSGGREARSGGWGWLLGDEGSGYWVGREAVRHALSRADHGEPDDALATAILQACGVGDAYDLLAQFYAEPDRHRWASRSSVVFELAAAGDGAALAIVADCADAISTMVSQVAAQLELAGPVALGGGLITHQRLLQDAVRARLDRHGIDQVHVLDRDPVHGAVYLARRALADGAGLG